MRTVDGPRRRLSDLWGRQSREALTWLLSRLGPCAAVVFVGWGLWSVGRNLAAVQEWQLMLHPPVGDLVLYTYFRGLPPEHPHQQNRFPTRELCEIRRANLLNEQTQLPLLCQRRYGIWEWRAWVHRARLARQQAHTAGK
jgi:hypothetical protein